MNNNQLLKHLILLRESNVTRDQAIILCLLKNDKKYIVELAEYFNVHHATMRQFLLKLIKKGFIKITKDKIYRTGSRGKPYTALVSLTESGKSIFK